MHTTDGWAERIDLVYEDERGGLGARLSEDGLQSVLCCAVILTHYLRPVDTYSMCVRGIGNGTRNQRLSGA